jgi:hypothetical protein
MDINRPGAGLEALAGETGIVDILRSRQDRRQRQGRRRRFVFSLSPRGTSGERAGERGKP